MITSFVCFSVAVHFSVLNVEGREPISQFFMVGIHESHTHTLPIPDTNLSIYLLSKQFLAYLYPTIPYFHYTKLQGRTWSSQFQLQTAVRMKDYFKSSPFPCFSKRFHVCTLDNSNQSHFLLIILCCLSFQQHSAKSSSWPWTWWWNPTKAAIAGRKTAWPCSIRTLYKFFQGRGQQT